jgi:hypothetical protein
VAVLNVSADRGDRDTELSMPVENAAPLLAALSALVASAMTDAEVNR